MKLISYLWLLPFCSFLGGYMVLRSLYSVATLPTPEIVGKQLDDAIKILSSHNLNMRILAEKNDPDLPPNIILSQNPQPNALIKPHQSVYIVLSAQTQKNVAPLFINKRHEEIEQELKKMGLQSKSYAVESGAPQNTCIGQNPAAGTALTTDTITTYISAGNNKPVLMPNFKSKPALTCLDFLERHELIPEIIHIPVADGHICDYCIVTDQRPLAGTLVTLSHEKPVHVQLQITPLQ